RVERGNERFCMRWGTQDTKRIPPPLETAQDAKRIPVRSLRRSLSQLAALAVSYGVRHVIPPRNICAPCRGRQLHRTALSALRAEESAVSPPATTPRARSSFPAPASSR